MPREIVSTDQAPAAIGTYSQAVKAGGAVYVSGQIPLDAKGAMVGGPVEEQIHQVFRNLSAIAAAAGGSLQMAVKLTIYLTDLSHFSKVNEIMAQYIRKPYPARAAVQVSALPKGAQVEADAILVLD